MDKDIAQGPFRVVPVGVIRKEKALTAIEIFEPYAEALHGIEEFSHLAVLAWFHRNDTPSRRNILRVHPRGDRSNPLRGVFATRSPVRPNPIGLWVCRLLEVQGNRILVSELDAYHGTPVLDVKPCTDPGDLILDMKTPDWVRKRRG